MWWICTTWCFQFRGVLTFMTLFMRLYPQTAPMSRVWQPPESLWCSFAPSRHIFNTCSLLIHAHRMDMWDLHSSGRNQTSSFMHKAQLSSLWNDSLERSPLVKKCYCCFLFPVASLCISWIRTNSLSRRTQSVLPLTQSLQSLFSLGERL